MIIHHHEQRSPAWFAARVGVISASNYKNARDKTAKGAWSAKAKSLAARIAVERISGESQDDTFVNFAMRRGTELEPVAASHFEVHTGLTIFESGFITTDCGRFGASPDGLVGDDSGVEIKCPYGPDQIINVLVNGDVSDYMDQIQGCMWITERSSWHLVVYTPQLDGVNRTLTVQKIERDDDYIKALVDDLKAFDELVQSYIDQLSLQAA